VKIDAVLAAVVVNIGSLTKAELGSAIKSSRTELLNHCTDRDLVPVPPTTVLPADLTAEMVHSTIYGTKMRERTAGREIYNLIKNRTPARRCSYCGVSTANTLDHVLEKSVWPYLSVVPENLVPACSDCNSHLRGRSIGNGEGKFHLYYENLPTQPWIECQLTESAPIATTFVYKRPPSYPLALWNRLQNTVDAIGLSRLYAANAPRIVRKAARNLERLGRIEDRADHMKEMVGDYEDFDRFGYEYLTTYALSRSDWFIDAGYTLAL